MTEENISPAKRARLDRILEAAEKLFVTRGFRGTAMEAIANEAGISKVTLYNYFSDKEAAFRTVAEKLAEDMQAVFDTALTTHDTPRQCIAAALSAKHALIRDRVRQSPFAAELFLTKDRIIAARFADLDRGFITQISDKLQQSGATKAEAHHLAEVLFAASQGIANAADSTTMMENQLATLGALLSRFDQPPK